jgi:hypothetical protein
MKAYITKYVFTAGIIEVDDAETTSFKEMIKVSSLGQNVYFHGEGKDWHRDKGSAIKRAEEMRKRKLASIEKQRRKIEAMVFD